ncbi:hypothetical protein ABEX43_22630 [Brevibacillus porteri]
MPGNDNKFMEIDDIVDNLVTAGIISAQNFIVNVELFKGSPITVGITKTGEAATDIAKEVNAGESIKETINTKEGIDYT